MNNSCIVVTIFIGSVILGLIKYGSISASYKDSSLQLKIIELWNDFANYFVAGILAYYFVVVRLPLLFRNQALTIADVFLFIIFLFGLFGHLCIISNKITEAVGEFIATMLKKKAT